MRTILNFIIDKLLNATPCASLKYLFFIFISVNSKTQAICQSEPLGDFFGNIFRKLRKWPICNDWRFVEYFQLQSSNL